jgi:hypothetical protein
MSVVHWNNREPLMSNRYQRDAGWRISKIENYHLSKDEVLSHSRWLEFLNHCDPA